MKQNELFFHYTKNDLEKLTAMLGKTTPSVFENCVNESGMTLLHQACIDQNVEVLTTIASTYEPSAFKHLVNLSNNEHGWTPGLWAAHRQDIDVLQFLVD